MFSTSNVKRCLFKNFTTRNQTTNPRAVKLYIHNFAGAFPLKTAPAGPHTVSHRRPTPSKTPPGPLSFWRTPSPVPSSLRPLARAAGDRRISTAGEPHPSVPLSLSPPPPQALVVLVRAFLRCRAAVNPSSWAPFDRV